MTTKPNKPLRVLTGIQATGQVHLGNYLGAIKPALSFQEQAECYFFIADIHALNTVKDPKSLKESIFNVASAWIAAGFDWEKHVLYRQSDIPCVTELTWYLGTATNVGLLNRAHAYKDAIEKGKDVQLGLFAYPVLMAADILLYDANIVPVGKDQKQHLDITRDIASAFNAQHGACLTIPKAGIQENVMTIPGIDGRKMSKSYDNVLPLFAPEKELLKSIKSITTDSTPLEAPKEIDNTIIGQLLAVLLPINDYADYRTQMLNGGIGWGHAKEFLYEVLLNEIKKPRQIYNDLISDKSQIEKILAEGKIKAENTAFEVIKRIRDALGL